MGHPPLITSATRWAYRTRPFFIRPSVGTLSLNDGDEWQWSIAITNADRGGKHFLIDPRGGGAYGGYRQDQMWSERRGCDALMLQVEESVSRACSWGGWHHFINRQRQMTDSKSVWHRRYMTAVLPLLHQILCDRPLFWSYSQPHCMLPKTQR